jgi:hypothetical protein
LGWVNPLKEEGGKLQAFAISGSRDDGMPALYEQAPLCRQRRITSDR